MSNAQKLKMELVIGIAVTFASSTSAFDMGIMRVPLVAGAVSPLLSSQLCLRGGQVQRTPGPKLAPPPVPFGRTCETYKVGLYTRSKTRRLFVSLRTSEGMHGGGGSEGMQGGGVNALEKLEEEQTPQNDNGAREGQAPLPKDQRAARRQEFQEKRVRRLAGIASGATGLGKVRQHVNPLSPAFRHPIPTPHWCQVYGDVSLPLHLDLGCGKGRMLLEMAKLHPDRNFLGVEIREALVVRADRWVREHGLKNLHFVSGNINVSVESLVGSYPGAVDLVSVLMPDPWFKNRHKKRRLLQRELVEQLASRMPPAARFFVMSDVKEAAEEMVAILEESPSFSSWQGKWVENPLPIGTERELACMSRHEPIYRAVFTRQ